MSFTASQPVRRAQSASWVRHRCSTRLRPLCEARPFMQTISVYPGWCSAVYCVPRLRRSWPRAQSHGTRRQHDGSTAPFRWLKIRFSYRGAVSDSGFSRLRPVRSSASARRWPCSPCLDHYQAIIRTDRLCVWLRRSGTLRAGVQTADGADSAAISN